MDRPHCYHHAGRLRQGDSEAVDYYAQHAQYDRATQSNNDLAAAYALPRAEV